MVLNDKKSHCFYCEREFNVSNYGTNKPCAQTRDHIIPVSKGGNSKPCNMVYSCIECNNLKGSLSLERFVEVVKSFIDKNTTFKTIPITRLYLIIKKAEFLIPYVAERGNDLYHKSGLPKREKFRNEDIFHSPIESGLPTIHQINKSAKRHFKSQTQDVSLSVNSNTRGGKITPVEKIPHVDTVNNEFQQYLINQTPEQFRLAKLHGWKIAQLLTAPQENFHYL